MRATVLGGSTGLISLLIIGATPIRLFRGFIGRVISPVTSSY